MTEVIRQSYLTKLESFKNRPNLIKIITGVRRSGKSTILNQFRKRLESSGENVVFADLEKLSFSVTNARELHSYISERMSSGDDYLLLDEVQFVRGWETVINNFRANGANIYVTGSNAEVLSSEFSTLIAGRFAEIHVTPFSFSEFLDRYPVHGDMRTQQRFEQFLLWGGLPIIDVDDEPWKNTAILEGVYDSIVNRDIAFRSGLKTDVIRRITSFMYYNTGNTTTADSLMKSSGIMDRRTADRYLESITDSFIFYKVDNYDLIGKRLMKTKAKYYPSDTGVRNVALHRISDDASGLLENIVFLELKRRGYDVVVGSYRDYEIDFTARKDGKTEFFQVSKTIDDSTRKREERSLKHVDGVRTVLSTDFDLPSDGDVRYMNLTDWLLSDVTQSPVPTEACILPA